MIKTTYTDAIEQVLEDNTKKFIAFFVRSDGEDGEFCFYELRYIKDRSHRKDKSIWYTYSETALFTDDNYASGGHYKNIPQEAKKMRYAEIIPGDKLNDIKGLCLTPEYAIYELVHHLPNPSEIGNSIDKDDFLVRVFERIVGEWSYVEENGEVLVHS